MHMRWMTDCWRSNAIRQIHITFLPCKRKMNYILLFVWMKNDMGNAQMCVCYWMHISTTISKRRAEEILQVDYMTWQYDAWGNMFYVLPNINFLLAVYCYVLRRTHVISSSVFLFLHNPHFYILTNCFILPFIGIYIYQYCAKFNGLYRKLARFSFRYRLNKGLACTMCMVFIFRTWHIQVVLIFKY